jgi:hypothetical protein
MRLNCSAVVLPHGIALATQFQGNVLWQPITCLKLGS